MAELNTGDTPVSGGGVKSIQRLSLHGSGTKAISPVDPNKTVVNNLSIPFGAACGDARGTALGAMGRIAYVKLLNGTTVEHNCITIQTITSSAHSRPDQTDATFDVEIIEYN